MAQFPDKEQAESYCTALKKETDERTAADWLAVEKAKFLAENEPVLALPKERDYRVGDTIRLDGKDFTIETVGTLNIQLRDPDEVYPVAQTAAYGRRTGRTPHLYCDGRKSADLPGCRCLG